MHPRLFCVVIGLVCASGWALGQTTRPAAPAAGQHDESRWLRNVRQLTAKEMGLDRAGEAYFSPDMKRIAFQAYPAGQQYYQIYVLDIYGAGLKMASTGKGGLKMVSTGQGATTCAYFHPNGERMLFASNHEDQRPPDPNEVHRRRDVPDVRNGGRPGGPPGTRPAHPGDGPPPSGEGRGAPPGAGGGEHPGGGAGGPPGGSAGGHPGGGAGRHPGGGPPDRGAPPPGGQGGGRAAHQGGRGYVWEYFPGMEIYEYTFATGELKNLTKSDKYDAEASYSPDGKLIMFSSLREGAQQVFIANADGSNPRRISNGPGDGGPFFSPDGKRVIYRGDRKGDGNMQIFVNNLEGTAEKAITPADALYWCPYWHPSGKWVAFTYSDLKQMPPRFDVYVMRDDGSDMQRVTSAGAWNGLPVFSPDGKYLMWTSKRGNADTPQIFIADFVGLTPEGDVKR